MVELLHFRLDKDAQTVHHLTARALPNELCDHPVCDRVSFIFESLLTHVESMMAYLCVVDLRYDIEDLDVPLCQGHASNGSPYLVDKASTVAPSRLM